MKLWDIKIFGFLALNHINIWSCLFYFLPKISIEWMMFWIKVSSSLSYSSILSWIYWDNSQSKKEIVQKKDFPASFSLLMLIQTYLCNDGSTCQMVWLEAVLWHVPTCCTGDWNNVSHTNRHMCQHQGHCYNRHGIFTIITWKHVSKMDL